MTTEQLNYNAFLAHIKANPPDVVAQGVLADWLDERGRHVEAALRRGATATGLAHYETLRFLQHLPRRRYIRAEIEVEWSFCEWPQDESLSALISSVVVTNSRRPGQSMLVDVWMSQLSMANGVGKAYGQAGFEWWNIHPNFEDWFGQVPANLIGQDPREFT